VLDRDLDWAQWEYDAQEPPEGKVVATCAYCGRDIFEGEKVYRLDDGLYCTDCITEEIAESELPPDEY